MSEDKKKDKELQEFVVLVRQINKLALEKLKVQIEGINRDRFSNGDLELLKFALSIETSVLSGFHFRK